MKAVIMAGGKGTRISSITTEIPKCMLRVGSKPIIEHQIDCLKKSNILDIIIVIGHLGDFIKNYFGDGKLFGVNITYIEEETPLGTAGALYYLKDMLHDDFIFIFGDIFLSVDFNRMKIFHSINNSDAKLFVHPNTHPFDSVLVNYDKDYRIIEIDSNRIARTYDYENNVNAGIFIFSSKIFHFIKELKKADLENEIIIPMLLNKYKLFAYKSTEYAKDMGTPERYNSVNNDYLNKIPDHRNLSNPQKCIFLDRDGTINKYVGFLTKKEQLELIDGVANAIAEINKSEYLCIIVTNQPVIARGECTFEELHCIHKKLQTLLGNLNAYVDDIFYCPHHPDSGFNGEIEELKIHCTCRKPNIGLLLQAKEKYNIDLENSILIGDSTMDIQLAKNANMKSILVHTGLAGKDSKYNVSPDLIASDLKDAIKNILN